MMTMVLNEYSNRFQLKNKEVQLHERSDKIADECSAKKMFNSFD